VRIEDDLERPWKLRKNSGVSSEKRWHSTHANQTEENIYFDSGSRHRLSLNMTSTVMVSLSASVSVAMVAISPTGHDHLSGVSLVRDPLKTTQ
jgi:hypothetical protein